MIKRGCKYRFLKCEKISPIKILEVFYKSHPVLFFDWAPEDIISLNFITVIVMILWS